MTLLKSLIVANFSFSPPLFPPRDWRHSTRDNVTAPRHTSHLASRSAPLLGDSVWLRKHLTDGGLQKCDVIRVKHNEVWKLEIIKQPYFTALSPECLSSGIPGTNIWIFQIIDAQIVTNMLLQPGFILVVFRFSTRLSSQSKHGVGIIFILCA